ncbi:MAG: hypothetical protein ACRDS9_24355 [Pseudonocardiaceae bacterium]
MGGDVGIASEERYEKTTAFVWTERAFELLETGKLRAEIQERRAGVRWSHMWGQCPRCGHRIDDWRPLSAVTGLVGGRVDQAVLRAVTWTSNRSTSAVDAAPPILPCQPTRPAAESASGSVLRSADGGQIRLTVTGNHDPIAIPLTQITNLTIVSACD